MDDVTARDDAEGSEEDEGPFDVDIDVDFATSTFTLECGADLVEEGLRQLAGLLPGTEVLVTGRHEADGRVRVEGSLRDEP